MSRADVSLVCGIHRTRNPTDAVIIFPESSSSVGIDASNAAVGQQEETRSVTILALTEKLADAFCNFCIALFLVFVAKCVWNGVFSR